MNGYNFTERVRKVLAMAREEAARLHHEYVGTEHILLGLIREGEGVAATVLQNLSVELDEIQQKIEETVKKGKAGQTTGPDLPYTSRAKKVLELAMSEARELNHSYVGTEHLLLGLLREEKGIAAQVLTDAGVNLDAARAETLRILGTEMPQQRCARQPAGSAQPQPAAAEGREEVEDAGARPLLPRSHAARRRGSARSDDRAREGDPARDGSADAPQEEQPGAHRRARRRQDGDRRRAGAAHRERRVPGVAARQPRAVARHGGGHRGHEVSRPVRGAPQGGDERDRAEQEHHPVHRRAAHARRCGRGRRRDRREQHAQARARARRAAVRRCVDAQRVSQVHREGRRARAPLPDGDRRSALDRGDGRDPQGAAQEVRGSSQGHDPRHDARARGEAVGALHHRPLPAGQGDRRDRRSGCAGAARRAGAAAGSRRAQGRAREGERREGSRGPRPELREGRVAARQGARDPGRDPQEAGGVGAAAPVASPGARRGGDRVHRQPLDGHSGHASAGGGDQRACCGWKTSCTRP